MRFLLLTIIVITSGFALFGQTPIADQPVARKFDEFVFTYENYKERAARFAEALSKEPNAKAYIIAYDKRVYRYDDFHSGYTRFYLENALKHRENNKIDASRIVKVKGGLRNDVDVELFIVPPGATPPKATPTFADKDLINCPAIRFVMAPRYVFKNTNSPLNFYATVSIENTPIKPIYKWTVSAGKIVSGQGALSIIVERPAGDYESINATLKVEGFPKECPLEVKAEASPEKLSELPLQIDEFGALQCDDELARLDQLAIGLQADELAQGYIITYGGKRGRVNEAKARAAKMKAYLVQNRGIASNRIITIDGGFQEGVAGELWLTLKGQPAPAPRPTLERKDVKLIGTAKIVNRSCGYGIY